MTLPVTYYGPMGNAWAAGGFGGVNLIPIMWCAQTRFFAWAISTSLAGVLGGDFQQVMQAYHQACFVMEMLRISERCADMATEDRVVYLQGWIDDAGHLLDEDTLSLVIAPLLGASGDDEDDDLLQAMERYLDELQYTEVFASLQQLHPSFRAVALSL